MKQKIKELSREKLEEIFYKITDILSEEQYKELEIIVKDSAIDQ